MGFVNMDNLLNTENIKLDKYVRSELYYIQERYDTYIKELIALEPKKLKNVLQYIRYNELEKTQQMESVPETRIKLNLLSATTTSIDEISRIMQKRESLTLEEANILHSYLIEGTDDDIEENHGYRKRDVVVSGINYDVSVKDGRVVRTASEASDKYQPPKPEDVEMYMKKILDYLNSDSVRLETDTIFIKCFIVHALIAILQPFGNGNSRLARLIQHGKIMEMTNELYDSYIYFDKPILCLSENYKYTRDDYRTNISNIAKAQNQEELNNAWNKWFLYNLYMAGEQMNVMENLLEEIKRMRIR